MEPKDRFVSTRHGRIHCREQGAGEGPPLLLLHSNGCSAHEYAAVMDGLAREHRCIAWDLPGHGDSDPAPGHLRVADYADVTVSVMDALQIDSAHVCGASIGGMVCMALGVAAPERVASLVVVEAALRTQQEWAAQWPRIEAMFAVPTQTQDDLRPRFRTVSADLLTRWNIDRHKAGGWRMVDVMWAIREHDALADLARLAVPCTVLLGDKGPAIASRARYEQSLPAERVQVLAGAGHFPMIDDPAAFTAAVLKAVAGALTAT